MFARRTPRRLSSRGVGIGERGVSPLSPAIPPPLKTWLRSFYSAVILAVLSDGNAITLIL
jgi:hypothetical protein